MSIAWKVGRNDPCPCGSGKKFKRCCLKKAADVRSRGLDQTEEALARQMIAFAEPLLPEQRDNPEVFLKALRFSAMCWDIALLRSEDAREAALKRYEEGLWKTNVAVTDEDRAALRRLARTMIERHREMFPEMHDRSAVLVTKPA